MGINRAVPVRSSILIAAIFVALIILSPTLAWATADDQKETASEEEIAAALLNGVIKTEIPEEAAATGAEEISALSVSEKSIKSIYGETQYDTAAQEALHAYASSATVIVASGESYVDALSATSLAGALDCPILLTARDSVPSATAKALKTLGAANVIVVGGTGVVSDATARALGCTERLWGVEATDTQLKIYEYGRSRSLWDPQGRVIVATGSVAPGCFADALSASPIAFKSKIPVFITEESGELPDESIATLLTNGFKQAIIAGGPGVVPRSTEGVLQGVTAKNGGGTNVVRKYGETLYDTSAALAAWAVEQGFLKWDDAAIATGWAPYDALAGSVVQGKAGSVLLIADPGHTNASDALVNKSVSTYKYFGGPAHFNNVFKVQHAYKMSIPLYEIAGLVVYVDAGHGWDSSNDDAFDWGASGSGYREFNLTKELANKVANELRNKYDITVYVNDDGGYYAYRQAEAYAMNAGVLVSIHFNAGGGSGTESYIHSYNAASGSSILQSKTHAALVSGLGLTDRGMKNDEFAVCGGRVPAVLLEIAFIDNRSDMDAYRAKKDVVAQKIAEGIAA